MERNGHGRSIGELIEEVSKRMNENYDMIDRLIDEYEKTHGATRPRPRPEPRRGLRVSYLNGKKTTAQ